MVVTLLSMLGNGSRAEQIPSGDANERPLWTTSRVVGSPDPPLPYTTVPRYPSLSIQGPIYAKAEPGTDFLIVVQQGGDRDKPTKIFRVADDDASLDVDLLLEIPERLVYGLAFHPVYARNGHLYLFSNGPTPKPERKNRISRFVVDREGAQTCDADSEVVILEWRSMGHDGGELAFGRDGMLYISSGDGTSDSDVWLSAQDTSNLLGGVLRIDVDRPVGDRPYSVPTDNPFLDVPRARPELWAIGLRNPWRLWSDRQSGQIWVGNNGQDLWETAHLIRRGENYGWSVYEGSHPFYIHRQRGPGEIVAPTIEHHHTQFRSLTGGVVYRGSRHPELDGAYVYGDYSTGKIWGARHNGDELTWHQELADTTHQIAGFAISPRGELLVVDHGAGIASLVRSTSVDTSSAFPRRLSDTGLFTSIKDHAVQPGVIPYSVNAPGWNDGADVQRFVALPSDAKITMTESRGWNFPEGAVLMQTLSLGSTRIETRLLTRQQNEWAGYSYQWTEQQDEALLVPTAGADVEVGQADQQARTWRIPSRAQCMTCHSRAVNFVLSMTNLQMNQDLVDEHGNKENQLLKFSRIGMFTSPELSKSPEELPKLVDPYDEANGLQPRARSYLHTNCSGCHVEAGGGNARMELEFTRELDAMRLVQTRPQHDTFGIVDAMLVRPSQPNQSVLYQRVSRRGRGQMPPLGSRHVDVVGTQLIRDWISSMEPITQKIVKHWTMEDLAPALAGIHAGRSLEQGRRVYSKTGCIQCHKMRDEGGGAGPNLTDVAQRLKPEEVLLAILEPSKTIHPEYALSVIQTADGEVLTGRVERETDSEIVVRTVDSFATPKRIQKSNIEDRGLSKTSMMPAGVLDICELDEVLDLLAFLTAGGDPKAEEHSTRLPE